jgi:cation:H+ antiporter
MVYVTLIAGLALLLLCGDFLVRGAVAIASKLGIPSIIIGLTIVAFGTSAPELVVSLRAALAGSPGIAIGNVVGSNIANVLLVLGVPTLIAVTECDQPFVVRNTVYVLGASILFIVLAFMGPLTWWHGAIMLTLLAAFLVQSGMCATAGRKPGCESTVPCAEEVDPQSVPRSPWVMGAFLLAGLIGLPAGAHLTVAAAQDIAMTWGVPEAAIGLTLVAIGTSLPELATTVAAIMRGHCGLALGNVLGSNLFNILAIMGITSVIVPIPVPQEFLEVDLWVMLAATLAITPYALRRKALTRLPAVAFVVAYISYVAMVILPKQDAIAAVF